MDVLEAPTPRMDVHLILWTPISWVAMTYMVFSTHPLDGHAKPLN